MVLLGHLWAVHLSGGHNDLLGGVGVVAVEDLSGDVQTWLLRMMKFPETWREACFSYYSRSAASFFAAMAGGAACV